MRGAEPIASSSAEFEAQPNPPEEALSTDSRPGSRFQLLRTIKLGTFHIGSSAADLLVTGIWNRIMIVDLGAPAAPIALLSAIRYLLAPLSLWAGHRSDTRPIFGSHRLAYIWLGRGLMLLSLPLLPISAAILSRGAGSLSWWALTLGAFLLFGTGTLISGPAYLALVHDSAPYARRGQAISIVQFILVASFAFLPLTFARLLPIYDAGSFLRLGWIVTVGAAVLWFVSVWREERAPAANRSEPAADLRQTFALIWTDLRTRRYAAFLGASAFFAFMQDAVLEPFGGDVFGLTVGETTRFNAFWGSGVLLGMVLTMLLTRRWRPDRQVSTTAWGLLLLALPLFALGAASWIESLPLVRPTLMKFGLGFGVFTVGGVSLLMAMSVEGRAGAYLGLWSVILLVARGAGIAAGGVLRDLALGFTGSLPSAYALVFWVEAVGAILSIGLLLRVNVAGFAMSRPSASTTEALSAAD